MYVSAVTPRFSVMHVNTDALHYEEGPRERLRDTGMLQFRLLNIAY